MKSVPEPAGAGKWERVRRLRYGHVLKLIRYRYGAAGVPDDEAGRPDLMELIWLASSAPAGANKKVRDCIELYAPWMDLTARGRSHYNQSATGGAFVGNHWGFPDAGRLAVRQVLGAIAQFEKASAVAKLAAARKRKREGRCEGRKPLSETRPEVVALARKLRLRRPKGGRLSLREVAKALATQGYFNERGKPYAAKSVASMLA